MIGTRRYEPRRPEAAVELLSLALAFLEADEARRRLKRSDPYTHYATREAEKRRAELRLLKAIEAYRDYLDEAAPNA